MAEMSLSPCEFVSGCVGGVAGLLVGHPFDTVKVRMQIYDEKSWTNIARQIYHNEGPRGFFKGYPFPVMLSGIMNAVYFGVSGNALRKMLDGDTQTHCCEQGYSNNVEFHWKTVVSGCLGGLAGTLIGCPAECVKTRQQGDKKTSKSTVSVIKRLYKQRGIRGLYCGGVPTLCRNGIGLSAYVLSYEHVLCVIEGELGHTREPSRVLSEMVSGGFAGAAFWMVAMPFDVVKSRIQFDDHANPKYKGMIDCFRQSFRADGYSTFTKGLSIALIRSVPANATTLAIYQFCMRQCKTTTWK